MSIDFCTGKMQMSAIIRNSPNAHSKASDTPFEFSFNLDEDAVRSQFETASTIDDFDSSHIVRQTSKPKMLKKA
jgi:hypothetical protein